MQKFTTIYLGLGSSLEISDTIKNITKEKIINSAILEIQKWGKNFKVSNFFYSEPWGGVAQNQFLNAVCSFEISEDQKNTEFAPEKLLKKIHILEKKFERTREKKWEDRTLDIDILLYGEENIKTEKLIIPHQYILERDFVYEPLLEIMPDVKNLQNLKIYIQKIC